MSGDITKSAVDARRRTTGMIWPAAGILALGLLAAVAGALGAKDGTPGAAPAPTATTAAAPSSSPAPTVTTTPAPAAPATEHGKLDKAQAATVLETALSAPITSAGTADDLAQLVKNTAVDAYAAELTAQWQELIAQGWTISGSPTLVSAEVSNVTSSGNTPTATLRACLDSSDVLILDANEEPIGDRDAMTVRALHLFTLSQSGDGVWRIAAHTFPNDPTC